MTRRLPITPLASAEGAGAAEKRPLLSCANVRLYRRFNFYYGCVRNTPYIGSTALAALWMARTSLPAPSVLLRRLLYNSLMPEISRFFGIVIAMYHREHEPAHFHARYSGRKIIVRISDGSVFGEFPPRALALVLEWWNLHREELAEDWKLARDGKSLKSIEPLE